jgi:hypothetical protein
MRRFADSYELNPLLGLYHALNCPLKASITLLFTTSSKSSTRTCLACGKKPMEYDDRTCIIVINILEVSVGLIVDNVEEVLTIDDEDIAAPPGSKTGFENRYIKGIGKAGEKVQLLLDCLKLLKNDEMEMIEGIR